MGPVSRVRLTVAYDGRTFHGFAANAGVRTVAGELIASLTGILRLDHPIEMVCAGRTDRGVHAYGQVVSFDVPSDFDLVELVRRVNRRVGPQISVRDPQVMDPDFDARFNATSRRYRYLIWNRPEPDPFLAGRAWHVLKPLDLDRMRLACDPFIGLHDFGAFCRCTTRADGSPATLKRRITEMTCVARGDGLFTIEIEAKAFCQQMVRSIVGTVVEVGYGRRTAGGIVGVIASGDRTKAGDLALPEGLYLLRVGYGPLTRAAAPSAPAAN